MSKHRNGIVKVIVIVILAVLLGVAFMLMQREQQARTASETAMETMNEILDQEQGITPEEVREKLGRKPHVTREPGKHRFVEEYQWKGPMGQHTIYAYYTTGATKLLEAVSLNKKLDDWEGDALKLRQ